MADPFMPYALDGLVNSAGWTAIAPAVGWDSVVVSNLSGAAVLRLRRIAGDPSTEVVINTGFQQPLVLNAQRENTNPAAKQVSYRFPAGVVAFYLKTDSGTGTGMSLLWG
jgi:hypothetical protein